MTSSARTHFTLSDLIDDDWFMEVPSVVVPDASKAWHDQMKHMRENPFEARWVTFPNGKRWLFINAEPQDWRMY